MIVKIFSNKGGGSPKASIDYLLGKDRQREGAKVLSGDPELSRSIAESLEFKNRYTVGCLSFEEREISPKAKIEIMEKFEKTIFAGMEKDQYNITWIEHSDKNRVELNFFMPNVELRTDKRLQPYYDRADRPLTDNFQTVINHEYGLSDPHAFEKKQLLKIDLDTPRPVAEFKKDVHELILNHVAKGEIKSQENLVEIFTNAGLEVSRATGKSISIKNPDVMASYTERNFMNKQELLKNLKNTLEENKAENSKQMEMITKEIISELSQNLEKQLQGVPKGITNYILNKTVLTAVFTSITMIILAIWLVGIWQIKGQREQLERLQVAQVNYASLEPYINLDKIQLSKEDDGTMYITSQSKNAKAYNNKNYTAIMSLTE